MPVQVLKNDLTCCIDNPNFEAQAVGEALLLDWDKEEFKIDEPEWEISVLEEPNETSELEIMPDEDETGTDQIESENYFGLILDDLEIGNTLPLEFPNGFQVNQFMETSKENLKLDSDWDTKEKLAKRQIQLLDKVSVHNQLMTFLKIQWHRLANSLEKKDVTNQET